MGVGQALVGLGILMMLTADLIGFFPVFFYIVFYVGAGVAASGLGWLLTRNRESAHTGHGAS